MAYYYKDEYNKDCYSVQEIFDIDDVDIKFSSFIDLIFKTRLFYFDWYFYLEFKLDIENEVEDRIQEVLVILEFQSSD